MARLADAGISGDQDQFRARRCGRRGQTRRARSRSRVLSCTASLESEAGPGWLVLAEWKAVDPAFRFPCSKAVLEITLQAGRSLAALLGRLGEQLHDDRRDRVGHFLHPFGGGIASLRDVAVHPFHGIDCSKRQGTCEHLVKRDAERIQIAAGIDRTIHASSLFWRHIGEGARDGLGRLDRLPLARKARCDAKPCKFDLSARAVHQDICRFEVLVDEAVAVELRQAAATAMAKRKNWPNSIGAPSSRSSGSPLGLRASAWFDRARGSAPAAARPGPRPTHPSTRIRERVDRGWRMSDVLQQAPRSERSELAVSIGAPFAAEDALAVLPQDFETISPAADAEDALICRTRKSGR